MRIQAEIDTELELLLIPVSEEDAEKVRSVDCLRGEEFWSKLNEVFDEILPKYGLKPGAPYPGFTADGKLMVGTRFLQGMGLGRQKGASQHLSTAVGKKKS